MFEGTIHSMLLEQKDKIDFDKLEFPIYRKAEKEGEWYKFNAVDKFTTVREKSWRGNLQSAGEAEDVDVLVFVDLYSNKKECTAKEFDDAFRRVWKVLDNGELKLINTARLQVLISILTTDHQ